MLISTQDSGATDASMTTPEVTMLVVHQNENGEIVDVQERQPGTGDSDDGGEVVAYAVIPSEATTVCYADLDDIDDIAGGGPGSNPWAVLGTMELVDVDMIQGWEETYHPFETWSEEPGEPGVYFHLNVPLSECDGCAPVDRCSFTLACGEVAGTPACWHDSGDCNTRGDGVWLPWCCTSQWLICTFINSLPIIGNWLCPYDECVQCYWECVPRPGSRDNPCHSCGFCGGSGLLCHIVPGGHC